MAVRPIDGTWSKFVWNLSKSESLARKFRDGKACLIDLRLAVEAQPTITPPNEPLTLEQLREMDGDKINIHFIGDCAGFYEDETSPYYGDHEQYIQRYNGMLRVCDLPLKYYGTQWTATLYRRPPEGEEDHYGNPGL